MRNEEKLTRAIHAKELVDNPLFQEIIQGEKSDLFDEWAGTKWFQWRKREKLWSMVKACLSIENKLKKAVNDGKMVERLK